MLEDLPQGGSSLCIIGIVPLPATKSTGREHLTLLEIHIFVYRELLIISKIGSGFISNRKGFAKYTK